MSFLHYKIFQECSFQECHKLVVLEPLSRKHLCRLVQERIISSENSIAPKVSAFFILSFVSITYYLVLCQYCKGNDKLPVMVYFDL